MRAVSFVERLEYDFAGPIFKNALALGDVDNDGLHELVVANQNGDLAIFKGENTKSWRRAADLGMVTAIGIGDIFNQGHNSLVVINGEGWCYVFDFSAGVGDAEAAAEAAEALAPDTESATIKPCHVQRIPANTKVLLLHDVNADGLVELVIGLTDRVVRTYQWTYGKLLGLNKWEFANQIGTVTINDMASRTPSLLVAHPGGTFIRLKCKPPENATEQLKEEQGELLSKMSIDYHPLAYSHMRNPNVSTEILGNISQGAAAADGSRGALYAVATLDGTLMLVQDEQILWSIQVDHQLFALSKLDVTGDGREEVVACSWDGQTYIVNQEKQSVRFQFDHSVSAFCAGRFSLGGAAATPTLVYATFSNKVYVYHNVTLPRITLNTLADVVADCAPWRTHAESAKCLSHPALMRELVGRTLYADP